MVRITGSKIMSISNSSVETPIRIELRAFFVQALKPAEKLGERRRRKVELSDHGEVLTSDEVLQRLEKADDEKKK